jgi:hypothetical protein
MKRLLLLSALAASQIFATPVSINYTNLFYSTGGSQLGAYENFAVRNVTVTTDTAPASGQPNLRISTSFNFGSNPVAAYNFASTVITASDLFFRNSAGTIQYGIPLVSRASNFSINGVNTTNGSSTTAGRLYQVVNPSNNDGLWRSEELGYTPIFGANGFGSGRAVLLDPRNNALSTVNNGSAPSITFNGTCTTNPCTPEFTFSFAFSNVSSTLLAQFANGSLTPYFTGSTCGNDLVTGVPEPSSIVLMSSALVLVGLRLRRKK